MPWSSKLVGKNSCCLWAFVAVRLYQFPGGPHTDPYSFQKVALYPLPFTRPTKVFQGKGLKKQITFVNLNLTSVLVNFLEGISHTSR